MRLRCERNASENEINNDLAALREQGDEDTEEGRCKVS
jgi:hypothetical protein